MYLMAMSDQKNELCKEFIKYLFGHGGSYTDLLEIELVHIAQRIMAHQPPPHQLQLFHYMGVVFYVTNGNE